MNFQQVVDIGSKLSLAVVLMLILVGGIQGYWVAGTTYRDMVSDRDGWKDLALKGTKIAENLNNSKVVGMAPPPLHVLTNDTKTGIAKRLNALEGHME